MEPLGREVGDVALEDEGARLPGPTIQVGG